MVMAFLSARVLASPLAREGGALAPNETSLTTLLRRAKLRLDLVADLQKGSLMSGAKIGVLIVGVLAIVAGLIWMGQGAGLIRYPASSFMIDQSAWIWRGAGVAVAGVVAVVISRRMQ